MIKRILSIIVGIATLLGCEQTQSKADSQEIIDSALSLLIGNESEDDGEVHAFAGAFFGMTLEQVEELDYFKNWVEEYGFLTKRGIRIGDEFYNESLSFHGSPLASVHFRSATSYTDYTYNRANIKSNLNNLRAIFEAAYGKPIRHFGLPRSRLRGFNTLVYKWVVGNKTIMLGVDVGEKERFYEVSAHIYFDSKKYE